MRVKKLMLVASILFCGITLNSCILKLPFQLVGNVVDDVTPF